MQAPEDKPISKHQYWTQQIAAWKNSGQSQQAFCTEQQLTYSQFIYWRSRLKQDKPLSTAVTFLPVQRKKTMAGFTLRLNGQHCVDIGPGFNPDLLRQVVAAVEQSR